MVKFASEQINKMKEKDIKLIVAIGREGAIGIKGDLIWHISEDLRRFKRLTSGHPVIMGRKTWESLPKRPLPGRRNIVVTTNPDYEAPGAEIAGNPEEALRLTENEAPFIIGGAEIYRLMLPYATHLYLTEIDAAEPLADAHLKFDMSEWEEIEKEGPYITPDNISYSFVTYKRKQS